jgi:predicted dehydrogenase
VSERRSSEGGLSDSRKKCRVAIVGAGYMAREHVRAFRDVPGAEVAGIYSRTRGRAEALAAEFRIPSVCDTAAELFERTAADLVVVSVPELAANEVCHACFEHPWTALVEKPAGYNLADAQAIESAARSRGRKAYVALNRRHYGSTRTVAADLATLEGPRLIKVQDQEDPVTARESGQPKLVVENWMYANSIHLIDYFRVLGRGRIVNVAPSIRWDAERPRYVAATIAFDSGDVGLYEAVWDGPGPWAVSVNTPQKRWEMRPLERAAFQLAGKRVLEPAEDHPWDTQFKPGLRRQAELAVRAAAGEPTELPTLGDALESMRLTQAIYS